MGVINQLTGLMAPPCRQQGIYMGPCPNIPCSLRSARTSKMINPRQDFVDTYPAWQ